MKKIEPYEKFRMGIWICTLGSICITMTIFLITSPLFSTIPLTHQLGTGEIVISFIAIPNIFLVSGLLLIISGIVRVYDYLFGFIKKKRDYLIYVSDFLLASGLSFMLIASILTLYLSITEVGTWVTPKQFFGTIFNQIWK